MCDGMCDGMRDDDSMCVMVGNVIMVYAMMVSEDDGVGVSDDDMCDDGVCDDGVCVCENDLCDDGGVCDDGV